MASFSKSFSFESNTANFASSTSGSFVFGSSAVNSSSALGFRKKERIDKRRNKCRTSSPLHTSDAIGTLSAEQAPSGIVSFKAKSDGEKKPLSNSPLPLTMVTRILNGIPQSPHFYQLRNYSELTRNNLISAWDRIFEETVIEIHSLQAMDFWIRAKRLWKTIEELQNLGYNVIALRRRLVDLGDIMTELKWFQFQIKGLKIKAENHKMEKSRLLSLIENMQALAKKEEDCMESKLIEATKLENELPKFDAALAKLAIKPI
ncbi:hypothetical protein WN944_017992 [Citrus x changshan-huyou]|uniref:Uncharacterized protein n=1 Tax=Citrus x changshan-huyou TaxID=2935761 RepID=A0AAP0QF08_9ROSI